MSELEKESAASGTSLKVRLIVLLSIAIFGIGMLLASYGRQHSWW